MTEEAELSGLFMLLGITTSLPFGESNESLNAKFAEGTGRSLGPHDGLEALLALQMVQTFGFGVPEARGSERPDGCWHRVVHELRQSAELRPDDGQPKVVHLDI